MKRFFSSSLTFRRLFLPSVNKFTTRTHNCGELTKDDIGKKVEIYGWLLKKRFTKFLIIHDKYGYIQAKIPENSTNLENIVTELKNEDVLKINGIVKSRGKDVNYEMKTGEIEIEVEDLEILNKSEPMPFPILSILKPELE
uniref:OB domain-containing protein n=1 Tax=Panagrolaimus sp. JU765 TaxID=591449 RepID=A0AC34R003_9BILA